MDKFICPECGSNNEGDRLLLNKEISDNENKDPWSSVLEQISCGDCGSVIPAHLAERWDNLSVDAAKKEWLQVYKKGNKKQKIL